MTKYDIIFEALQDQVESGDLTVETAEYLNDIAYELYSDDMYTEATGRDSLKEYKKKEKEFKKLRKEFKTAVKKGDIKKAKSIFKELKKIPNECEKILDEIDKGIAPSVIGLLLLTARVFLMTLIASLLEAKGLEHYRRGKNLGDAVVAAHYRGASDDVVKRASDTVKKEIRTANGYGIAEFVTLIASGAGEINVVISSVIDDINKGNFSINSLNPARAKIKTNIRKLDKNLDKLYNMM